MKYLGFILVAMLIAISACAKVGDYVETGNADGDEPAGDGKISFVLPQADNVVTYTAASAAEGGLESDVVVIYAFSPSLRFEQRYAIPYIGGTPATGGGRQYSITMRGRGKHNFVLLQTPANYPVPQLSAGSTLGDLTSALTKAATGKLSPPFVMSNAQVDGKPYITVEDIGNQSAPVQVSMKSRVARLDIDDSDCTILGVDISNAAPAGRMFDNDIAPTAPSSGGLTYSLDAGDLANGGRSFYLYPTVLKAGATGTTVKIRAKLKSSGVNKAFTVMTGADLPIEAGRLYGLSTDTVVGVIVAGTVNFSYKAEAQTFTAPYDGVYTLEAWGAQATSGRAENGVSGGSGGLGGYSKSTRTMKKGEKLYIYTGEIGSKNGSWNGGGTSGANNAGTGPTVGYSGGGGATDFRTVGGAWDNTNSLNSRILVAGGGGGGGNTSSKGGKGGNGGGGGGGISPGGDGVTSGGGGGRGGSNQEGSPTGGGGGSGGNGYGQGGYSGGGGVAQGGNGGFGGVSYDGDGGCGGGGGGGYGGGGGGGPGSNSGSGGGGGGGGGSYGASEGSAGVNYNYGKARVSYSFRIRP
jgi:hypothetical protein